MKRSFLVFALLGVLLFGGRSDANFALFQLATTPLVVPSVVCVITTGTCTGTGGGTSLFTAATCNGVSDDAAAFVSFNSWAVSTWQGSHTGLIELDIPHGSTCLFIGTGNCVGSTCPFTGIKRIRVVGLGYTGNGDGATLSDNGGTHGEKGFFLGALSGVCFAGLDSVIGCSARIQTVSAGSSCVNLIASTNFTVAQLAARFTIGNYSVVTGLDQQGGGDPPNPILIEWKKVTSIDSSHKCDGVTAGASVALESALVNTYKSTWPLFQPGDDSRSDQGGPATIYALTSAWDTEQEYIGLTISQIAQTNAKGRDITFRNMLATGIGCPIPTENYSWSVIGADMSSCRGVGSGLEIDKMNGTLTLNNVTIWGLLFQTASVQQFNLINSTVQNGILGSSINFTGSNSTIIGGWSPGPGATGYATRVDCTACNIDDIFMGGVVDSNPLTMYTMTSGVIQMPYPVQITAHANNGSGLERITLACSNGCAVPTAGWVTGQSAQIDNAGGGSCPASITGAWVLTVIDSTRIDLQGSTFAAGSIVPSCLIGMKNWPPQFGFPGQNMLWSGSYTSPPVFQVTDVSQDLNNLYITTTNAGSFPGVFNQVGVRTHPAPIFNCSSCTGAAGLRFSGQPTNAPLGSYWTGVVNATTTSYGLIPVFFGTLNSLNFNVTHTYGGAGSPLADISGPFVLSADGTTRSIWDPSVDPKIATNCTITNTTSDCPAQTSPGSIWLVSGQIGPRFSASVGADAVSVTVTVKTNQGVVVP